MIGGKMATEQSDHTRAGHVAGQAAIECRAGTARHLQKSNALLPRQHSVLTMHGQAATETLVLIGFALAFILPLVFLFMSSANSALGDASIVQAKITARTIADEAGEIYLQGAGAQKTIWVNYPEGIKGGKVENGLVVLSIDTDGRQLDIVGSTFANVTGNLSGKKTAGIQRIRLQNVEGYFVNITYG